MASVKENEVVIAYSRSLAVALGVLVVGPLLMASSAAAQEERTRSFVYNPKTKAWMESPPPSPGTPEASLHKIKLILKQRKYRRALSAVKRFIKRYGRDHPLYPEALIAQAKALIGKRAFYKAHLVLQAFQGRFGSGPLAGEARRLEYVIAETFLTGVKRKFWGIRLLSGEDLALQVLDELSVDDPQNRLTELALKTKGDYFFRRGEHALAESEYARLLSDHPQGRYHQFASRRTADAALARFGGIEYDESALIDADERFREYQRFYPASADREDVDVILDDIREKQAAKSFAIGRYYERTRHLSSAIFYYQLVRKDWPGTVAATKATARLELLGVLEAVPPDAGMKKPIQSPETSKESNG